MDCKFPPLTKNIEGLRQHSHLLVFVPEDKSPGVLKWRAWLLHMLVKAARHYSAARQLVLLQTNPRLPNGGAIFPVWDLAFEVEDCLTSLHKALQCVQRLESQNEAFAAAAAVLAEEKGAICAMRNVQEHLFTRLPSGQTGPGPVLIQLDKSGDEIRLGRDRLSVAALHQVIEHLFDLVATQFSQFDPSAPPQPRRVPGIEIQAEIVIETAKAPTPK